MRLISRTGILVLSAMALSMPAHTQLDAAGQPADRQTIDGSPADAGEGKKDLPAAGGPFSTVVLNTPFSANAVTRVREHLPNGGVRQHTVTAALFRDSQGRVLAELKNAWGPYVVLWIPGSERGKFYRLDPAKRTYRVSGPSFAKALFNGEGRVALPVGDACFRVAPPVAGASGTERLQAVKAEIRSDLGLVVASHRSDRIASVDYQLTNIRRDEPPAGLFELPADYTFLRGTATGEPLIEFEAWNPKASCAGRTSQPSVVKR